MPSSSIEPSEPSPPSLTSLLEQHDTRIPSQDAAHPRQQILKCSLISPRSASYSLYNRYTRIKPPKAFVRFMKIAGRFTYASAFRIRELWATGKRWVLAAAQQGGLPGRRREACLGRGGGRARMELAGTVNPVALLLRESRGTRAATSPPPRRLRLVASPPPAPGTHRAQRRRFTGVKFVST